MGLPDDLCGELPLAFVVPYPNKTVTEKEIQDFVKGNFYMIYLRIYQLSCLFR